MKALVRAAFHRAAVGSFSEPVVIQNLALPCPAQGLPQGIFQRLGAGEYSRKSLRPLVGKMLQQKGQLRRSGHKTVGLYLIQPQGKGFARLRAGGSSYRWGLVNFRRWSQHVHPRSAQSLPQEVGHAVRPLRTGQQHSQPLPRTM